MVLSGNEIKRLGIIQDSIESSFRDASYDLSVLKIIDMEGKEHDSFALEPQGLCYIIFKERLKILPDIIGFAHIKTKITYKGLWLVNTGLIDPGYNGYMSSLVMNFGKSRQCIEVDEKIMRLTFSQIFAHNSSPELVNQKLKDTIKERRENSAGLPGKFLDLDRAKNEIVSQVGSRLLQIGVIFSALSLAIALGFNIWNSNNSLYSKSVDSYKIQNELLVSELNKIHLELSEYKSRLEQLYKGEIHRDQNLKNKK